MGIGRELWVPVITCVALVCLVGIMAGVSASSSSNTTEGPTMPIYSEAAEKGAQLLQNARGSSDKESGRTMLASARMLASDEVLAARSGLDVKKIENVLHK